MNKNERLLGKTDAVLSSFVVVIIRFQKELVNCPKVEDLFFNSKNKADSQI